MLKKSLSLILALFTLMCTAGTVTFSASAEPVTTTASDKATTDEAKLVLSDEPKASDSDIDGLAIGYMGDSNTDGKINIKDATAIQKHLAKYIVLTTRQLALADSDYSAKLNIKDATAIQKYVAGIEVKSVIWHLLYEEGKHFHSYTEVTVSPTCAAEGYTLLSCICGDEQRTSETAATGHLNTEVRNAKESTDTSEGYTGDTYCTDCGALILKGETIEKTISESEKLQNIEQTIFDDINEIRKNAGLKSVKWDSELYPAVEIRVNEHVYWNNDDNRDWDAHDRPNGKPFYDVFKEIGLGETPYSSVGEILAIADNPESILECWMDSTSHRNVILSEPSTHMSICVVKEYNQYYACAIFRGEKF